MFAMSETGQIGRLRLPVLVLVDVGIEITNEGYTYKKNLDLVCRSTAPYFSLLSFTYSVLYGRVNTYSRSR